MCLEKRWWLAVVLIGAVALFRQFDLSRFLSLAEIKSNQAELEAWRSARPVFAAVVFFVGCGKDRILGVTIVGDNALFERFRAQRRGSA